MNTPNISYKRPYTGYTVLNLKELTHRFPPKYPKVYGEHITVEFGVPAGTPAPEHPDTINVVGYVDSGDGLEALVVSVNGTKDRTDGKVYHLTWSLDPNKYSPKDSNTLIASVRYTIVLPIRLAVRPFGSSDAS